MFGQESLTVTDILLGKMQGKIGEVMQYKAQLIPYTQSSDVSIRSKAIELFNAQKKYEASLLEASGKISKAKEGFGPWPSIVEIASWGLMIQPISKHIDTVKKFLASSGKPPEESFINKINWIVVGIGGLVAGYLIIWKKGKK